ncbi:MAG: creatininase family protein [Anaerolineae bacterium]|nr:creatininase family protein [Anaerolineae bacterium]
MRLQHLLPHQLRTAVGEGWPLLVPTGCIEYHGPHMALGLDTILVEELLERVARRTECVVAPPFWYGPTGYAVTGPDRGTLDVSTERFGRHVKDVLSSFWDVGFKWIVVGVHHQQMDGPESLAIRQAAAEVTFEKTHAERGHAWWGKAPLSPADFVFERIQVWPSVLPEAADQGVVMADHAGFYETSLLMAARPELVELERLDMHAPWYCTSADSKAREASVEAGERMWQAMVDAWLRKLSTLHRPKRPTPEQVTITGLF